MSNGQGKQFRESYAHSSGKHRTYPLGEENKISPSFSLCFCVLRVLHLPAFFYLYS